MLIISWSWRTIRLTITAIGKIISIMDNSLIINLYWWNINYIIFHNNWGLLNLSYWRITTVVFNLTLKLRWNIISSCASLNGSSIIFSYLYVFYCLMRSSKIFLVILSFISPIDIFRVCLRVMCTSSVTKVVDNTLQLDFDSSTIIFFHFYSYDFYSTKYS